MDRRCHGLYGERIKLQAFGSTLCSMLSCGLFGDGKYGSGEFHGKGIRDCFWHSPFFDRHPLYDLAGPGGHWRGKTGGSSYRKAGSPYGRNLFSGSAGSAGRKLGSSFPGSGNDIHPGFSDESRTGRSSRIHCETGCPNGSSQRDFL